MKRSPPPDRQRGAALLTAMIIVTLVVTLASAMVWQQWRAVQVEIGERARAQASWILTGALDWAKLILRENQRSSAGVDHLGQPWAVPLAESRLSTFLAADKDASADDGPEAFLSGAITDAQARFNLSNLVASGNGKVDPLEYAALTRLCESLGLDAQVAVRIASGLQSATAQASTSTSTTPETADAPPPTTPPTTPSTTPSTTPDTAGSPAPAPVSLPATAGPAPLLPRSVSQLAWFGIDAPTLATLRPYVAILPLPTSINVNTASREVLAAECDIDLGSAERLVQYRQRTPFRNQADLASQLPSRPNTSARIAFGSSFFEVRGRLRLNDRVLEQRSLLQRQGNGQVTVIDTERLSPPDEPPGT